MVVYYIQNNGEFTLIDYINLLIHEGGHGVFSFFGKFVYTLGGTLMQIILPALFIFYFVSHKKKLGTQLSIIWLGESLLNIAVYVADARAHRLPLLGGKKVYHDWTFLLNRTNLLLYDAEIAEIVRWIGIATMAFALFIPLVLKRTKSINLDLNL